MSEEIDKHVLRKYEVGQRVGKGVSISIYYTHVGVCGCVWVGVHTMYACMRRDGE
jgi:hypothetical protein